MIARSLGPTSLKDTIHVTRLALHTITKASRKFSYLNFVATFCPERPR